ncbi:GGDEF domain-containing protein [Paractinoplanes maris]|uniref:GGDEF domain-containing protein n=1 Tax=Paractinoplanes maris TaxID=1734446 RepID=UPI0024C2C170|nr:GGDEF domain-containing protein [Actinoplanes maris]
MRWPRASAPAWPVHVLYLVASAVLATAYALAGDAGRPVVYTLGILIPFSTFALAIAVGHLPDRWPWITAAGGLVVLLCIQVRWPGWIGQRHLGQAEGSATDFAMSAAHLLFLLGAGAALRRRASQDMGGIIDMGLLGLCAGGPIWEWVVQPRLPAGSPVAGQIMLLADLLVMCGVIGCMVRMRTMPGRGKATIVYLAVGSALVLAGQIAGTIFENRVISAELLLLAFPPMAAAALHPDAPGLTARPQGSTRAAGAHLGWLTAALCANPLIAAVQAVRGLQSTSLLLPVGTLLIIPLVTLRIRQLSTQRDRAEQTLAYHATHDELTGLFNRRHIGTEIDRALAEVNRGELDGITVLLCDLDGFKPINDRYGHPAGDEVLKVVASRLTAAVRDGDLVGRLGGDEFVVVCRGAHEPAQDRITAAVRQPIPVPAGVVSVGLTIGAAQARPGENVDRDVLIGLADMAMYAGKAARRTAPSRR